MGNVSQVTADADAAFFPRTLCVVVTLSVFSLHMPPPVQSCDEFTDLNLGHAFLGTSLNTRYLLHTRDNVSCGTLMSHTNPSAHPQFDISRPTTFLIHGYRPTGSPPNWLHSITELLLARKDMNMIIVDWNQGATNVNYLKAVENTHKVADNLTVFIGKMKVCSVDRSSTLAELCVTRITSASTSDPSRNTESP